jgi:diacylglycerol kinase (ATP)
MRAVAILGRNIGPGKVAPFRRADLGANVSQARSPEPGYDAVLILGGDGTIHRHLAALVELQTPVLVVPGGSANDFARSLGMHTGGAALRAWEQFCKGNGRVRQVDLGVITPISDQAFGSPETQNSVFYTCIASTGLDAEANRRANAMPPRLRAGGGYVYSALAEIARWKPLRIAVSTSSQTFSEPATFVAIGNAPYYGDGMKMTPKAQLDDGLLDVCFVRHTSKRRLLTFFPTVFLGRHLKLPEVEYAQTPSLRLETERPMDVYADGEYICKTPVDITIRPRALSVISL